MCATSHEGKHRNISFLISKTLQLSIIAASILFVYLKLIYTFVC